MLTLLLQSLLPPQMLLAATTFSGETFDVDPEFPVVQLYERGSAQTDPKKGLYLRSQTNESVSRNSNRQEARMWELTWRNADSTQKDRVEELIDAQSGSSVVMDWTPPGLAVNYRVRFSKKSPPRITQSKGNRFSMDVVLEEAI